MKKPQASRDDPVVEEVRAIRARLWKEAGGTVKGLVRLIDADQPEKETAAGAHGTNITTRD